MYRPIHPAVPCGLEFLPTGLKRWIAIARGKYLIEVRARLDERRLRDADPRLLADVGLSREAIASGVLRIQRQVRR